jgi:hypothetical protein
MPQVNTHVTAPRIFDSYGAIRLVSYVTIWFSYLTFMSSYAPRGVNWLSWHLQRVYNAVEYVKVNDIFRHVGFQFGPYAKTTAMRCPNGRAKFTCPTVYLKYSPTAF